ncbi:hypothetical protein KAJ87_02495 [Candidatus Pacearchaeota archaeon]|nr:hypothetical protein [Candidatus Pacearchaeota archaeon]
MGKVNCGYCKKEIGKGSRECPHCGKKFKMFEEEDKNKLFRNITLKKYFSASLILSLSISALIGIFIFIFWEFGEVQRKILFTTLSLGGFSMLGLCAAIWYDKQKFLLLSYSGMISSVLGFLYSFLLIWEIIDTLSFYEAKPFFILVILSITLAYSCLILLAHKEKSPLNFILWLTIIYAFVISSMLIGLIIWEWDVEELFFRVLGVFILLVVLGTISTPFLNKIGLLNKLWLEKL